MFDRGAAANTQNESAPVSSVTFAVRAGSRYEPSEGVAHALKNFTFRSTKERSALHIVRETELNGGVLSAALSKEHLLVTAEFLKGDEAHFTQLLAEVLGQNRFLLHEFHEDVAPSMAADYEQLNSCAVRSGMDQLFRTAYRNRGLGNSLFANPAAPVTLEAVKDFAAKTCTTGNLAVVASGVPLNTLTSTVSAALSELPSGSAATPQESKYYGGDYRSLMTDSHGHPLPHNHFFLAYEGASTKSAAPLAVLQALLGGESNVKWTNGLSPLSAVSDNFAGARARAFNISFADTGLFGMHVSAPQDKLSGAAKTAAQALDKAAQGASSDDIKRAVANAKFNAASTLENDRASSHDTVGAAVSLDRSLHVILIRSSSTTLRYRSTRSSRRSTRSAPVTSPTCVYTLPNFAHTQAAQQVLRSKPTTVALGDLKHLPYADELLH